VASVDPSIISGFLQRVRALVYRHHGRRTALYVVAALAASALVWPVVMRVGGTRTTAVAVLGLAGLTTVLVLVGAVVLGHVAPRRRYRNDPDLARWVGTRHRAIASDLLSSVQLATATRRPGGPSPALVEALARSTSQRLEDVDPVSLMPVAELSRARRYALAAVAANAVVLLLAPHLIVDGWRQILSLPGSSVDTTQLSAIPLVGDLEARLEFPAYARRAPLRLMSTSGDVRGLPGTAVSLRARILVPNQQVELVIESDTNDQPQTLPATVVGDQLTAKFVIERAAHYRFAVTSPSGIREIEATARSIEVEPDQPPIVQLMVPSEPLDVTNLRRVELAYTIEDDFGLTSAELVWESNKDRGKKPIALGEHLPPGTGRAQGKLVWDIAELQVPSGGEVRYWIEARDNDNVGAANVGRSREFHLRVVSARERHEETLGHQQAVAEKLLRNLASRLVFADDNAATRDELNRQIREIIVELGSITAAFEKDPHASDAMRKALGQMRDRLERLANTEVKWVPKGKVALKGAFAAFDPRMIGELEDDTIVLSDWLDRERLEGLLDVSDEIAAHQKRLSELLAQYQRTKDPRLLDEIEREMRALDKSYADLEHHRQGMPEDVLDQYVNRDAVQPHQGSACIDEVRKLVRANQMKEANRKLEQCMAQHDRSASMLEDSLSGLRGDRFSDEQRKLDEVMNELADVAKDQDDIAAESSRIFDSYAAKADELAKEHRRDASKKVGALVDKLRARLKTVDENGLTPFAKEELDIVERRLVDVEKMVADGDLAEALGMAHQAKQSLDTIASELEAAIEDDPKSKWADATQRALDGIRRTLPVARELIDELQSLAPRPDQIMSADDKRALDRLRRREAMNRERTKRLGERTKQLGGDLPGDAAEALTKKLGGAVQHMQAADERMKARDPSGTREAARAAADALAKARERARSAARQAQEGAVGDEPVKIPGAENYRAPEKFREDLLEAMKKQPQPTAPSAYDDMLKRYYEDLIK